MDLTQTPAQLSAFTAMLWAWSVDFLPRAGGAESKRDGIALRGARMQIAG